MRVQMLQDPSAETFSKQLLDIGDGKVTKDETGCIKLPDDLCTIIDSQDALINLIFPDVYTQYIHHEWLAERAILAAENADVNELNLKIQQLLPGNLVTYKSVDTVCDLTEARNFPTEFLNSLDSPGIAPHNLALKVGSPMCQFNLNAFSSPLDWHLQWQGQAMSVCVLDLSTPCFSHGQLYVACSRVGKQSNLFVFAKDGMTKDIVHSIALRD
ncbi:uncharacterized protein [Parasteatoda tepidariorum]|uniref:uncharacterized protein n=1 Tax=Parasteatoda tepidariorum TaxID=114398 RepID=UPI0039BC5C9C